MTNYGNYLNNMMPNTPNVNLNLNGLNTNQMQQAQQMSQYWLEFEKTEDGQEFVQKFQRFVQNKMNPSLAKVDNVSDEVNSLRQEMQEIKELLKGVGSNASIPATTKNGKSTAKKPDDAIPTRAETTK